MFPSYDATFFLFLAHLCIMYSLISSNIVIIGLPLDSTKTLLKASDILLTNVSDWAIVVNLDRDQNLEHNNYINIIPVCNDKYTQ